MFLLYSYAMGGEGWGGGGGNCGGMKTVIIIFKQVMF